MLWNKSALQYVYDAGRIYSELDEAEKQETSPADIFRQFMFVLEMMDRDLRDWELSEANRQ